MQGAPPRRPASPEDTVAVASTGVIGVPLPIDRVRQGIAGAAAALRRHGWRRLR